MFTLEVSPPFPFSYIYAHMHVLQICGDIFVGANTHVYTHRGLKPGIILNHSSTVFTGAGSLNQTQSSLMWLVPSAASSEDPLSVSAFGS